MDRLQPCGDDSSWKVLHHAQHTAWTYVVPLKEERTRLRERARGTETLGSFRLPQAAYLALSYIYS